MAECTRDQEIALLRQEIRRLQERQRQTRPDGQNGEKSGNDHDGKKEDEKKKSKPHPLRKAIIIAAVIVIAIVAVLWWMHSRHFENTDDAYIDAHTTGIAARIPGNIVAVYSDENQFVKAGQVIVDLDPRDYQTAFAQVQAQLRQALDQARAEQPNLPLTEVTNATGIANAESAVSAAHAAVAAAERNYDAALEKVREAQATNAKSQADVERYRPLAEKDEVPHEQFDQVVANAKAMAATVAANQASSRAAQEEVDEAREQLVQAQQRAREITSNAPRQIAIRQASVGSREGAVQLARAQLQQAGLNLSYCKIPTPVNGIVAKRIAEVGMHVTPGQQLFLVSELDDLWVTANFRETQLRHMRAGQGVRIHVDAINTDFDGYLESMPAASGAVTSLLPPENATGNFVKIVQRLPVRIRFNKNQPGLDRLRPGMSVEPKVRLD